MKYVDGSTMKVRRARAMTFEQIKAEAQTFILKVIFVITITLVTVIMHVL